LKIGGPRVKVDGKWYDCVYFANEKGGMTADLFPDYIEQCVLPCCTGMGPEPENNHLILLDGDDSHAIALFKDIAKSATCIRKQKEWAALGLYFEFPPPNTSQDLQHADDDEGPFHTFQMTSWPNAKSQRKKEITRAGLKRPLENSDIPTMLGYAWDQSLGSLKVNQKAAANIGIEPFTRAPLWRDDVQKSKGDEQSARTLKHLDYEKIRFRGEEDLIPRTKDEATVEFMRQLGGNKFNSGVLWKYVLNSEEGIYVQELYAYSLELKQKKAAEEKEKKKLDKEQAAAAKALADAAAAKKKAADKKAAAEAREQKKKTEAADKKKALEADKKAAAEAREKKK